MPTVSLTNEQVTDLVRQLPPAQKRAVLTALAQDAQSRRADGLCRGADPGTGGGAGI